MHTHTILPPPARRISFATCAHSRCACFVPLVVCQRASGLAPLSGTKYHGENYCACESRRCRVAAVVEYNVRLCCSVGCAYMSAHTHTRTHSKCHLHINFPGQMADGSPSLVFSNRFYSMYVYAECTTYSTNIMGAHTHTQRAELCVHPIGHGRRTFTPRGNEPGEYWLLIAVSHQTHILAFARIYI